MSGLSSNNPSEESTSDGIIPSEMPLAIGAPPPAGTMSQRRQPQNLQGVLRYSIEAGAGSTSSAPSTMGPMDPERRRFLEATLSSMTVNPVDRMKRFVAVLYSPDASADDCETALEEITDLVDNIDNANDFHKIGAFDILLTHLASPASSIRSNTAKLIAVLSQNNPYIQSKIVETDLLKTVLNLMNDPVSRVQIDALYAVSCIIRGNEDCLRQFSQLDGWSTLLNAMTSPEEKLQLKAAFLVTSLTSLNPTVIEEIIKLNYVQQLCGLLVQSQPPVLEHLLRALVAIVSNNKQATSICQENQVALYQTLKNVMDVYEKDSDEFQFAETLKKAVFSASLDEEGER